MCKHNSKFIYSKNRLINSNDLKFIVEIVHFQSLLKTQKHAFLNPNLKLEIQFDIPILLNLEYSISKLYKLSNWNCTYII